MKVTPTQLMKELTLISAKIADIHKNDIEESGIEVDVSYTPCYKSDYSFQDNRQAIEVLFEKERNIKIKLNEFNNRMIVPEFNITIAEALVRMAQLKSEIKTVSQLAGRNKYYSDGYGCDRKTVAYDIKAVKEELAKMQHNLSQLQIAVDKINLTSLIDFD